MVIFNFLVFVISSIKEHQDKWLVAISIFTVIVLIKLVKPYFGKNHKVLTVKQRIWDNNSLFWLLGIFFMSVFLFILINQININNLVEVSPFEIIKLIVALIAPLITLVVLYKVIKVQDNISENIGKSFINHDFYELLKIFDTKKGVVQEQIATEKTFKSTYLELSLSMYRGNSSVQYKLDNQEDLDVNHQVFYGDFSPRIISEEDINVAKIKYIQSYFSKRRCLFNDYLNICHLILKTLNQALDQRVIQRTDYDFYIAVFRSQLSADELALLYYYAVYSRDGYILAIELINSNLFGNYTESRKSVYFEMDKLMNVEQDLLLIGGLFNQNGIARKVLKKNRPIPQVNIFYELISFEKLSKEMKPIINQYLKYIS